MLFLLLATRISSLVLLQEDKESSLLPDSKKILNVQQVAEEDEMSNLAIGGCFELWESWNLMEGAQELAPNPINCCNDLGITCGPYIGNGQNMVQNVDWENRGLKGIVPARLLSNAEYINLSKNKLVGFEKVQTISTGYFRLSVLIVKNNLLENNLEFPVYNVPPRPALHLAVLDLSHNLINGPELNSITSLMAMGCPRYLNLSNNALTGLVDFQGPRELAYCSVTHLSLANNRLTSMGHLHNLSSLEYLDLRNNNIESHFLNPRQTPGFSALQKCLLGVDVAERDTGGTNHFCIDDDNQVPAVCGSLEKWYSLVAFNVYLLITHCSLYKALDLKSSHGSLVERE